MGEAPSKQNTLSFFLVSLLPYSEVASLKDGAPAVVVAVAGLS